MTATANQMRKIALAMPDSEEKSHFEQPDFRVRGKIFCGLSKDQKRGTLKLTPEIQSTVVGEGSAFEPCQGQWGRSGWTYVDLKSVDVAMLKELITESWRLVAPKTLVAKFDDTSPTKTKKKKKR